MSEVEPGVEAAGDQDSIGDGSSPDAAVGGHASDAAGAGEAADAPDPGAVAVGELQGQATRELSVLAELPLPEHPEVYQRIHTALQGALADIDEA